MRTFSLAESAAGGAPAPINRAEVADALGVNRYSAKVKWPSGGTKDRELSRFQRCNLAQTMDMIAERMEQVLTEHMDGTHSP